MPTVKQLATLRIGVFVDSPASLAKRCRDKIAITSVLKGKSLQFKELPGRFGKRTVFVLTGTDDTTATGKYTYKVVPFLDKTPQFFWLAVSLEFETQRIDYQLLSASIFIFEGLRNDDAKTPLIRAEWACTASDIEAQHAQPHWHIYPSQVNGNFEIVTETIPFDNSDKEALEFQESDASKSGNIQGTEWKSSENIHFAMASRWHDGIDKNVSVDSDKLPKWLAGCIKYTYEQLEYLYD